MWFPGSLIVLAGWLLGRGAADSFDPLAYVDPLIGSANGGNVFAGASLPYGLAKAVADVQLPDDGGAATGGFATDTGADGSVGTISGFSAVHDSGSGGNPSLGNFPLFPQLCPDGANGGSNATVADGVNTCRFLLADRAEPYDPDSVVARPGYFGLQLAQSGIRADMTTAHKTALFRFAFPLDGSHTPAILVDLTDLWVSRQNASVRVDPDTGRMTGSGNFLPSFGAGSYMLHFCADFYGGDVRDSGVWVNSRGGTEPKEIFVTRGFNNFYLEAGGFLRFNASSPTAASLNVTVRMGMSFISSDQACRNAEEEIPAPSTAFDGLVQAAETAWREKLSGVTLGNGTLVSNDTSVQSLQRGFWSGLYRNMLSPQNYTGENPRWESSVPYFDSYYCIWDSYRAQHPLLTILDPVAQGQMVASLLDIYRHEGWLPDCHMSTCQGWTQGGSNADIVLADALVKNLTIDASVGSDPWGLALEAALNDAENEPPNWSYHGRGGLTSWKRLGYIPYLDFDPVGFGTNSRSIARTLEYAYDDFAVATLAAAQGRSDLVTRYRARSNNWQALWRADQRSEVPVAAGSNTSLDSGFSGFFQPRFLNGTWGYQDPIACSDLADFCSLTTNPSETFEASIWQYQFLVPHDVASLIDLMGGDAAFIQRLDYFHTHGGLADISNEPVFLTVFLYHYAGQPAQSAARARDYATSSFGDGYAGLPGNDDSGAMGAFLAFSALGLFPVAGQNVYLITPPLLYTQIQMEHPLTGATATIRRTGSGAYIQSARLNGQSYAKSWLGHEFFLQGGTLELELGPSANSTWGTRAEDRPPSPGADGVSQRV